MTYFIIGINSFIAKSFYLKLRKDKKPVIVLNHSDLACLSPTDDDVIINCCGVNRATTQESYEEGNHLFLQKILDQLGNKRPYFLHLSSYMIHGFENTDNDKLPDYQKFFITAKKQGETLLENNYPKDRLCIIRPTNIYGYLCEPYYNNLLVTMVYEKLTGNYKVTKINKNCVRNFLSVDGLITAMEPLINNKTCGTFNVLSDQTLGLDEVVKLIHNGCLPDCITISDQDQSIAKIINDNNIVIKENLLENIVKLESQLKTLANIKNLVKFEKRDKLSQPRGDMVEISGLESKRLYMITLSDHSVRGNHYHYEQIEDFYIHKDIVTFLLAHKDDVSTVLITHAKSQDRITVYPLIIHTLVNDFPNSRPEIFITSTFPYIANSVPDTTYVNLI